MRREFNWYLFWQGEQGRSPTQSGVLHGTELQRQSEQKLLRGDQGTDSLHVGEVILRLTQLFKWALDMDGFSLRSGNPKTNCCCYIRTRLKMRCIRSIQYVFQTSMFCLLCNQQAALQSIYFEMNELIIVDNSHLTTHGCRTLWTVLMYCVDECNEADISIFTPICTQSGVISLKQQQMSMDLGSNKEFKMKVLWSYVAMD